MNNKKNFKDLIKPQLGRPRMGKERRIGKTLSLDLDLIEWLESTPNASETVTKLVRDAMDKQDYDSRG